jgi:DNA polymerase III epsilon subunit-like protein
MSEPRVVFFDTETGGLLPEHPTIQLAAIAVDSEWREVETFEAKIAFDWRKADPEALKLNHYSPAEWAIQAKAEGLVVQDFALFLDRHRSVGLLSKSLRPYTVARLGGHNVVGFDLERVAAMFKRHGRFFPVDFRTVLDTRYGAIWYFEGREEQPANFKLTGLAEFFGIDTSGAHDALFDVRLSLALAPRILGGWHRREAVA